MESASPHQFIQRNRLLIRVSNVTPFKTELLIPNPDLDALLIERYPAFSADMFERGSFETIIMVEKLKMIFLDGGTRDDNT